MRGSGRYQSDGRKNSETHDVFPSLILTAREITTDRSLHSRIFHVVPSVLTLTLTGFAGDIHQRSLAYKFALASF